MIGETVSHYRIVREIGAGGMGTVYEAVDTLLDLPVALKVIRAGADARSSERFLREARALATLDHPNICGFREIDRTENGDLFLVMPLCTGGSLEDVLRRQALSPYAAFQVADGTLRGLSNAHHAGIIHRDVKPANLLYSEHYLKIADFGLARLLGMQRATREGTSPGTITYMSPEQLTGRDVDARTDLWSLGIVLYRALTGRHPFAAEHSDAVAYRAIHEPHQPACELEPKIPPELSAFVDRCLAKNPNERFANAPEALAELGTVAKARGWADPNADTDLIVPRRPRRWTRTAILATATVLLATLGWLATRPDVYTTRERFVVLPFENRTSDPAERAFVAGLSEVVSEMLDTVTRNHESMWVIPYTYVLASKVTNPKRAGRAFGANRVVRGSLERYADGLRVSIDVENPSGRRVGHADVDFAIGDTESLFDALPSALLSGSRLAVSPTTIPPLVPDRATHSYVSARGHLQRTEFGPNSDAALTELRETITADSSFAPAQVWIASALANEYAVTRVDSLRDAALLRLDTTQLDGVDLAVRALVGDLRRRLGEGERSIAELSAVVAQDSSEVEASRDLARAYAAADRFDEAAHTLERATAWEPDRFVAHRVAGAHYYALGDYAKAIEHLQAAIRYAPDDGYSLNVLGASYHQIGDLERAQEFWERSFQVWPTCDSANNLGFLRYRKGEYEKSARYYEFALSYCDSTDAQAWGNLGRVLYWVEGRRDEALEHVAKALHWKEIEVEQSPADESTAAQLADYYSMLGRRDDALRMVVLADSLGSVSSETQYTLAVALETIGERDEALKHLARALERGFPVERVAVNPWLEALRKDGAYRAMVPSPR